MALLSPQVITLSGVDPSLAAAAGGGDTFVPSSSRFLHINNGGGSPITVTIVTPQTVRGVAIADVAVSVTNAQDRMIGPFPADLFADPSTGLASITYSGVTSVTVGILELSQI